jgi:hypothetical protein
MDDEMLIILVQVRDACRFDMDYDSGLVKFERR